jgi:hypothetical protein
MVDGFGVLLQGEVLVSQRRRILAMTLLVHVSRTQRDDSVIYCGLVPGCWQNDLCPEVETKETRVTLSDSVSKLLYTLALVKAECFDWRRRCWMRWIGIGFRAVSLSVAIPSATPDAIAITRPASVATTSANWLPFVALDFASPGRVSTASCNDTSSF